MRTLAIWLALNVPAPAGWRPRLLGAAIGRWPRKVAGTLLLLLAAPLAAQTQPDPFHLTPATGGGGGSGTVTSVALTVPSWLTVANSPVTTSGTLAVSANTQLANLIFGGPASGGAAAPAFRSMVAADLPDTIDSDTTGNADTATAAAADPANCAGGTLPRGVGDTWAAQGCAAVNLATETTGSAPTADALATNPANCSAGNLPRGVSATGTAEGCAAVNLATETTGAAPTATALASDPANCGAGLLPRGVDASGVAQGCAAAVLGTDTSGGYAASATAGGPASSVAANSVALGPDTTGGYAGSATEGGAATTATALAGDGTNCSGVQASQGVDASGNAQGCFTPAGGSPAGSGSELQFRSTGTTFGAVTSSSVSGADITLGGTLGGMTRLNVENLRVDLNTISSTDTNGNINLTPNGVGVVSSGPLTASFLVGGQRFIKTAADVSGPYDYLYMLAASSPNGGGGGNVISAWGSSYCLTQSTNAENGIDTCQSRKAAGVWSLDTAPQTTGTNGNRGGWEQWAGQSFLSSDFTNATATPSNISGLSMTLTTGRKYAGLCILQLGDSVAADGAVIDFDGGTATATTFRAQCTAYDTALAKSQALTTLAADYAVTTLTGDGKVECNVGIVTSGTGTFIPRAWQNNHTTGTLSVYTTSHCFLYDFP